MAAVLPTDLRSQFLKGSIVSTKGQHISCNVTCVIGRGRSFQLVCCSRYVGRRRPSPRAYRLKASVLTPEMLASSSHNAADFTVQRVGLQVIIVNRAAESGHPEQESVGSKGGSDGVERNDARRDDIRIVHVALTLPLPFGERLLL